MKIVTMPLSKKNIEEDSVLRKGIDELIGLIRSENIAAGKVDIVCHSMGGLLTRFYLQDEYYRKDIHKIISCNTPYYGTQLANLALEFGCIGFNCEKGAINDLQIWSSESDNTINQILSESSMPTHFIGSTFDLPPIKLENITLPDIIDLFNLASPHKMSKLEKRVLQTMLILYVAGKLLDYNNDGFTEINFHEITQALYQDANDFVVPLESQIAETKGYLSKKHISVIPNQIHLGSVRTYRFMDKIRDMLLKNPTSEFFYNDYIPRPNPPLTYEITGGNNIELASTTSRSNDSLTIYPQEEITVFAGDTINFRIEGTNEIKRIEMLLDSCGNDLISETVNTNIMAYKFIAPNCLAGKNELTVYGFGEDFKVKGFAKKTFLVKATEAPDSIIVNKRKIWMQLSDKKKIRIEAIFNSQETDISSLPDIEYHFQKGLATHIGNGYIKAKEIGEDTLIIKYKGITSVPIPIIIVQGDSDVTTSIKNVASIKPKTEMKLYPNPTNNLINIEILKSHGKQEMSISIFDMSGKEYIKKQISIPFTEHTESIQTSNLPNGMYLVTVSSPDDIQFDKFIKL